MLYDFPCPPRSEYDYVFFDFSLLQGTKGIHGLYEANEQLSYFLKHIPPRHSLVFFVSKLFEPNEMERFDKFLSVWAEEYIRQKPNVEIWLPCHHISSSSSVIFKLMSGMASIQGTHAVVAQDQDGWCPLLGLSSWLRHVDWFVVREVDHTVEVSSSSFLHGALALGTRGATAAMDGVAEDVEEGFSDGLRPLCETCRKPCLATVAFLQEAQQTTGAALPPDPDFWKQLRRLAALSPTPSAHFPAAAARWQWRAHQYCGVLRALWASAQPKKGATDPADGGDDGWQDLAWRVTIQHLSEELAAAGMSKVMEKALGRPEWTVARSQADVPSLLSKLEKQMCPTARNVKTKENEDKTPSEGKELKRERHVLGRLQRSLNTLRSLCRKPAEPSALSHRHADSVQDRLDDVVRIMDEPQASEWLPETVTAHLEECRTLAAMKIRRSESAEFVSSVAAVADLLFEGLEGRLSQGLPAAEGTEEGPASTSAPAPAPAPVAPQEPCRACEPTHAALKDSLEAARTAVNARRKKGKGSDPPPTEVEEGLAALLRLWTQACAPPAVPSMARRAPVDEATVHRERLDLALLALLCGEGPLPALLPVPLPTALAVLFQWYDAKPLEPYVINLSESGLFLSPINLAGYLGRLQGHILWQSLCDPTNMVQLPDSSPEKTTPGVEAADDSVADWMEEGESAAVEKYFWVALLGLNGLLEGGPSSSLDGPPMAIQVAITWLNTVDCADLLSDLAELMDPAATPTDVLAGSLRFVNFPDRLPTPPAVLAQYFGSKLERCNLFEDALRDDGSLRHHWQCISLDEGGGIRRTPCTVSLRGGLWGRAVPPQWLPDATACDEALRGPHHAAAVVSVDPVPPPEGEPHPVGLAQHHCQELWYSHLACRAASAMCMGGYHLAPGGWLTAEAGVGAAMWQLADCAEGPAILAVWYAAAEDTPMVLNFSAKKDHRQHVFPATGGWDVFVASGSLQMDLAPGWNQVILETVQGRGISIKEVIIQQPWKSAAFCY